jgi:hypothetical protein
MNFLLPRSYAALDSRPSANPAISSRTTGGPQIPILSLQDQSTGLADLRTRKQAVKVTEVYFLQRSMKSA